MMVYRENVTGGMRRQCKGVGMVNSTSRGVRVQQSYLVSSWGFLFVRIGLLRRSWRGRLTMDVNKGRVKEVLKDKVS